MGIAGTRLHPLTQFTFEVTAGRAGRAGTFVRRLVRGPFIPSGRISGRAITVRPDPTGGAG